VTNYSVLVTGVLKAAASV